MNTLHIGFGSVDITPMIGCPVEGYFVKRYAEGVLDRLTLSAMAVSRGETTALLLSAELCSIGQRENEAYVSAISAATGVRSPLANGPI